ncbi:MAG: ATP-dependent DNA ligase [Candidatus Aenigmarchaeota archaeon]|nr:ATP-dependent DNA ligase [Candidatus Aenigmarchaeota archaeon]
MLYSSLVEIYEKMEATTKKLEKRDILAAFFKNAKGSLYKAVHLSMGIVPTGEAEIGVAQKMMIRVICQTYGIEEGSIMKKFKDLGDLGSVAEYFAEHRRQKSFSKKELTIDMVFDNIRLLPKIEGKGSVEKKISLVSELLSSASPKESLYIVRTVLSNMRIGVAHGVVRDAIAFAFNKDPKEVEHAWHLTSDFGRVAEMAKEGDLRAHVQLFRPMNVMLAERAPNLEEALRTFENPAVEVKLDGFRAIIHKKGGRIKIFSRRLEDVTVQFPDLLSWAKDCLRAEECIVEGEVLAVDPKTRQPRPFQHLSRRIQRKYEIEKMVKEIPIRIDLFELVHLDGSDYMKEPLRRRWSELKKIVQEKPGHFQLIDHIETKDLKEAEKFYRHALAIGEEGVVIKNLDAHYQPGRRVGFWLKVKPIMEPLDLVVVGAEWSEGKRAKTLGSLILAARDGKKFLETGRMASGLIEKKSKENPDLPTLEELTKILKPLVIEEQGKIVKIKPQVVVEVGYEEIQKSPKYPTGYALRFPRLLRMRIDEKKPEDANTVKDIEKLFSQQKRFKR